MSGIIHLEGKISVDFFSHLNVVELCVKHIPSYEPERFEIVAVRVFSGEEFIVTVFALDKLNVHNQGNGKVHVKKFKIQSLQPGEFMNYVKAYNFTLSKEELNPGDMEVINK